MPARKRAGAARTRPAARTARAARSGSANGAANGAAPGRSRSSAKRATPSRAQPQSSSDRQTVASRVSNLSMPSLSFPALGDISSGATRIVHQAVNILEEEVAAGILAARDVESRFVDVEDARAGNAAELMSRIRKDAHELIDILVDLVGVAGDRAGDVMGRVIPMGPDDSEDGAGVARGRRGPKVSDGTAAAVLAVAEPIKPGSSAEVMMMVENDGSGATGRFRFRCTDLIDPSGHRIPPEAVRFKPATLDLGPESSTRMTVTVTVPPGTPSGSYSGMLQATKLSRLKAILTFDVA